MIYVADKQAIERLVPVEGNCFDSYEEEVGFAVTPGDFQDVCVGFVSTEIMREVLYKIGVTVNSLVHPQNLSRQLAEMKTLTRVEIEQVVEAVMPAVKKA